MRISVADAEGQLAELMKRAEQGEEVLLTQSGLPSARLEIVRSSDEESLPPYDAVAELQKLAPMQARRLTLSTEEKLEVFGRIRRRTADIGALHETDAARSQDFLYDEFGLPK